MRQGIVYISKEDYDDLNDTLDDQTVLESLKISGNLIVVEKQDRGWAQVDPPPASVVLADQHPVVESPGVGFGNLQ